MKDHVNRVHLDLKVKSSFKCEVCGKYLTTKFNLKIHFSTVHKESKDHICHICKCMLFWNTKINAKSTHRFRWNNFFCSLSGAKAFAYKITLANHVSFVHEKTNKKFQCAICDYMANSDYNLNFHIKTVHYKIRDHCCDRCGKRFSCPQALKKHYFKFHGGEDGGQISYKCDFCIGKKYICILGFCKKNHLHEFFPFLFVFCETLFFTLLSLPL